MESAHEDLLEDGSERALGNAMLISETAWCMINSDIHNFLLPYWHSQYCIPEQMEYENVEDEVLLDEEPDQDEADAATSRQAGGDSPPVVTSKYFFFNACSLMMLIHRYKDLYMTL